MSEYTNTSEYQSIGNPPAGSIRFNSDSSKMEIYNGEQWWDIDSTSPDQQTGGTRGVFGGGEAPTKTNVIQFVNVDTNGDTVDFGDATQQLSEHTALSNRTRGLLCGAITGDQPTDYVNNIDFITISSKGNASDFGDMVHTIGQRAACANSTRGIIAGGIYGSQQQLHVDYITITQTGNAVDFGDLASRVNGQTSIANSTRAIIAGGYESPAGAFTDRIQYFTISTLGDSTDFGNLTAAKRYGAPIANAVRGVYAGGQNPSNLQTIDFITISTTGDAADFGDLTNATNFGNQAGVASPVRGLFAGGIVGPARTDAMTFIQTMTTGNSQEFGDLLAANGNVAGMSNGHGGLG